VIDDLTGVAPGAVPREAPVNPGGELGKEEFLQLLVAQLRHQDPMNPANPEEFASQLAQFSSLEQMMNISESVEAMAAANAGLADEVRATSALSAIGQKVHALGDTVSVGEDPKKTTVTFGVGPSGGGAVLRIYTPDGREVGVRELGAIPGGRNTIELGEAADGLEPGLYRYEVDVSLDGEPVEVQTLTTATIDGVRFGGPFGPVLTTAEGLEIPLPDILEIVGGD
jgi:flagellar basal-body rod modification protein FlgD